jgi:uroporphyrinogen decarboxylase
MKRLFAHTASPAGGDEEGLLRQLGIDVRHVNAVEPPERRLGDFYQNYWGERYVYQETGWGPMRQDLPGALATAESLDEILAFNWPTPDAFDYSHLSETVRAHDEYAIMYGFADIWQRPALVRGWERMFVDMAAQPELAHALCRVFTDFYKADYTRAAEATGGRIDLYVLLSDLGTQAGPLMSLPMFRELVAPYIAEMVACIHSLGGKVMYHSCGAIRAFIPDLIALGVDVLDPIQPVNPEMSPESLVAAFGGQVCFHGGMDMQRLLPFGTPEEVRREAQRYCEVLGAEGGYILGPAHLFQPDVPPENVFAMYGGDA